MKNLLRKKAGNYSIIVFSIFLLIAVIDLVAEIIILTKTGFNTTWNKHNSVFINLCDKNSFLKLLLTIFQYSSLTFYLGTFISSCKAVIILNLIFTALLIAICIIGIINSLTNIKAKGLFNSKKPSIINIILLSLILVSNTFKIGIETSNIIKTFQNGTPFKDFAIKFFVYYGIFIVLITLITLSLIYACKSLSGKTNSILLTNSSFYTSMYQQPQIDIAPAKQNKKIDTELAQPPKTESAKSKRLISNIMNLENLKSQGRLSDEEYTKLKQKLIKEYEGK